MSKPKVHHFVPRFYLREFAMQRIESLSEIAKADVMSLQPGT